MDPIQIRNFDKPLDIRLTDHHITLPSELRSKIKIFWQGRCRQNRKLRNGEVFTVVSVEEDSEKISIRLAETDYAHYLYSRTVGNLGKYTVKIIHPAALVLTADNKFILGSMGAHTSLASTIQCCGGGIDRTAINPDNTVAIDRTIATELEEEMGINKNDNRVMSITPTYLKFGGPTGKMTLVYITKLNINSDQFLRDYAAFTKNLQQGGEDPEFDQLFCIDSDLGSVETFIQKYEDRLNEYVAILLRTVAAKQ